MIAVAHEAHPELAIQSLCALLGVSRSWFYDRRAQPASDPDDLALRAAIEAITLAFPGYGYRRVTKHLQRADWIVNHKRVLRIMREEALLCQLQRRFIPTTDSRHAFRRYPNALTCERRSNGVRGWTQSTAGSNAPIYRRCHGGSRWMVRRDPWIPLIIVWPVGLKRLADVG